MCIRDRPDTERSDNHLWSVGFHQFGYSAAQRHEVGATVLLVEEIEMYRASTERRDGLLVLCSADVECFARRREAGRAVPFRVLRRIGPPGQHGHDNDVVHRRQRCAGRIHRIVEMRRDDQNPRQIRCVQTFFTLDVQSVFTSVRSWPQSVWKVPGLSTRL